MLERFVYGIETIREGVGPVLEGTPFRRKGLKKRTRGRRPVALVAALGELGETDLPDPRSPGLTKPYDPTPRAR
jgi:hypothetical protein